MANVQDNQSTSIRSLKQVTGMPVKSTKGLLLSHKPYHSHYPLSTTSSEISGKEREYSLAVWLKNYGNYLALIF